MRPILYGILMWIVCLYAFRRGGWAERLAAIGIILATYLTVLVLSPLAVRFQHVEWRVFIVDAGLFLLLMFITLRSEKYWPMWLAATHGVGMLSHFAPLIPHMMPWVSANAAAVGIYPMLAILAFAVHQHHRETTCLVPIPQSG
jgi:hypothetical protein